MSLTVALIVFSVFQKSVLGTFPPVSNPPPIPNQALRTVDISGQRYFVQDELPPNIPQNIIKEEGYYPGDAKIDERWFLSENQSDDFGDLPRSDTFERYYADGVPAVGPVATPQPDDGYVAQPSITSKFIPDGTVNSGSPDIWVLTKTPNDQYVPEKLVQVQVPQDRVVELVGTDVSPRIVSEAIKSLPSAPIPQPIKVSGPPVSPNIQQIWVRGPSPVQTQKVYQSSSNFVQDVPLIKETVGTPPPIIKQYVQQQVVQDIQSLPPPLPTASTLVTKKSNSFIVPPPPPPAYKTIDVPPPAYKTIDVPPPAYKSIDNPLPPQQTFVVNQPADQLGDQVGVTIGKDGALQQVKYVWIPMSQNTGKFITVPVSATTVDSAKSISSKGVPIDNPTPISVSDTWILKQDGPLPRFEAQKSSFPVPNIQKGNIVLEGPPGIQFESPKNPPLLGKSIDAAVTADVWPQRQDFTNAKIVGKVQTSTAPVFPVSLANVNTVFEKSIPNTPPITQKSVVSYGKDFPSPLPPIVAPVIRNKPCPIGPLKSPYFSKSVPIPGYRSGAILNSQPFSRIIRINRYPYGSYYVLNPRIGPSLYAYPRTSASVLQQTQNGLVRLIPSRQFPVSGPGRQVVVSIPRRQMPIAAGKSVAPIMPQQILYPPVQAVNRIRYAYPWSSYLRSLPVTGKNVFVLPQNRLSKSDVLQGSSSSESSSSESSSSESKSKSKSKSKAKETKKIESQGEPSIETEEPEPEKESEDVESAASEAEEEKVDGVEENTEANESIEAAEAQIQTRYVDISKDQPIKENLDFLGKPYQFDQRNRAEVMQRVKKIPDAEGRVVGSYGYRGENGIFRSVAYVTDGSGYRAQVVSNEPGTISHNNANANFIVNTDSESASRGKVSAIESTSLRENPASERLRD